jgi:hypothetical protein
MRHAASNTHHWLQGTACNSACCVARWCCGSQQRVAVPHTRELPCHATSKATALRSRNDVTCISILFKNAWGMPNEASDPGKEPCAVAPVQLDKRVRLFSRETSPGSGCSAHTVLTRLFFQGKYLSRTARSTPRASPACGIVRTSGLTEALRLQVRHNATARYGASASCLAPAPEKGRGLAATERPTCRVGNVMVR